MTVSSEQIRSPFLDIRTFEVEELQGRSEQERPFALCEAASPFLSIYEMGEHELTVDPGADEVVEFLADLQDHEFDEAVSGLVQEATALVEDRFASEMGGAAIRSVDAERLLEEHFAPLVREAETLVEDMANGVEGRDLRAMSELEVEALLDEYAPQEGQFSLTFDRFLGKLWNKAKKTVKKAVDVAKRAGKAVATLGLGPVLNKLKRYIKPLLRAVLRKAINKLPRYLRPVARGLARRYLGRYLREMEAEEPLMQAEDSIGDVAEIQQVFDLQVAHLVFADDEAEQEALLAEVLAESERPADDPLRDVERARAEFIRGIGELEEGEDPEPLVEGFIPALLPILKLGLKLAGRKRVVRFLARYLARLIRRFVGRRYAAPLSRAVVDLGLKYFGLEATDPAAGQAAGEAVAYTVEETVRQVAALPDYILDDEQLLETEVVKAFEHAAASYLPRVLPEQVYEQRPDLRESMSSEGFWVGLPLRSRKRYRKFTGRFPKLTLSPHTLRAVKTWRGRPLASHMRNGLGITTGRSLEAQIHLYEAMPGTSLQDICKTENQVAGLGTASKPACSQLHPLTPEAAGLLLGEPGLGREVPDRYLNEVTTPPAVGQRFYYLEINGARPQVVATPGGTPALRQPSEVNLLLDFPRGQMRIFLFLSEAKAQEVAVKVRQGAPIGVMMALLRPMLESGLSAAISGGMHRRVKVIHSAVVAGDAQRQALKWLPQIVREQLEAKLAGWVGRGLSEELPRRAQELVAATESDADGVTLAVTLTNPPGLPKVGRVLGGEPVVLRSQWFSDEMPDADLRITPGYRGA
jgi:hypothetical protein